jgi:hypothetical protein
MHYRAIPLRLTHAGAKAAMKDYFIFLPGTHIALLDRERSEFLEDRDERSGQVAENRLFPGTPMYSWIKRFVTRNDCAANLFRCTETMDIVCSEEFKARAERKGLKGIKFVPIDDRYRYDPWGEIPA